jgi:hypothetical protein
MSLHDFIKAEEPGELVGTMVCQNCGLIVDQPLIDTVNTTMPCKKVQADSSTHNWKHVASIPRWWRCEDCWLLSRRIGNNPTPAPCSCHRHLMEKAIS